MTPFRDENGVLLERVTRLEDELRAVRAEIARTRSAGEPEAPVLEGEPVREVDEPRPAGEAARTEHLLFAIVGAVVVGAVVVGVTVDMTRSQEASRATTAISDPTSIAEARSAAMRAGLPAPAPLHGMKAWYVSSDGMLHENPAYAPRVEAVFAAPPAPVSSRPRPLGAPADPMEMFQDEYKVVLTPGDVQVEQTPFMIQMHGPVPDPHCRLADVWKAAQAAGAPPEAVAVIEYAEGLIAARGRHGDLTRTARWHFEIAMTPPFAVDVSDHDCAVMR